MKFGSTFTNAIILGVISLTGYVAGTSNYYNLKNLLRFVALIIASGIVVICMIKYQ